MAGKPIGELNGRWALLFKVTQASLPLFMAIVIPWCIWVTKTLHSHDINSAEIRSWMSQAPRFTPSDADNLRMKIKGEVRSEVTDKLGERINEMNTLIIRIQDSLMRIESATQKRQASIGDWIVPNKFDWAVNYDPQRGAKVPN